MCPNVDLTNTVAPEETRFTSSKLLLDRILWLVIASLIDFQIAILTYMVVHLKQPLSLAKYLKLKSMHVNTRHNDQFLQLLWVSTNTYGCGAFSFTVPSVWNILPDNICNHH